MLGEKQIDAMIEAGRQVLESDFDPTAFHVWRRKASVCVDALLEGQDPRSQDSGTSSLRGQFGGSDKDA